VQITATTLQKIHRAVIANAENGVRFNFDKLLYLISKPDLSIDANEPWLLTFRRLARKDRLFPSSFS
jgi:hypothetical protein